MIRNYFADLELEVSASDDDIRRAYKRLARRFHPDLNPGDTHCEKSFQIIREAFFFLSSTSRVTRLKKLLVHLKPEESEKTFGKWKSTSIVPVNKTDFAKNWIEEKTAKTITKTLSKSKKNLRPPEDLDLHFAFKITEKEWIEGRSQTFQYRFEKPCLECRGNGGSSKSVKAVCKNCAGLGFSSINRGAMQWKKTCGVCLGKGFVLSGPCDKCRGLGKIKDVQTVQLGIPKKPSLEHSFCLKNLGNISFDGKRRGNLWVQLAIKN